MRDFRPKWRLNFERFLNNLCSYFGAIRTGFCESFNQIGPIGFALTCVRTKKIKSNNANNINNMHTIMNLYNPYF